MKLDELRTALNQYEITVLREIIITLYKKIPKNKRETEGIDDLLLNFTQEKAKAPKIEAPVDFVDLEAEIELFIEYADQQYYFAPNMYVRKDKRSKWRFEVKRFIKELLIVKGENCDDAAKLLVSLYDMLSYACHYYIFSTNNPFTAVGYSQPELLQLVIGKVFYNGYNEAAIKTAVFLTLDSNTDRDTIHTELMYLLVSELKTPDAKEQAIIQCIAFQKSYDSFQASKKVFTDYNDSGYRRDEHKNHAVELYLLLKFSLYEYDDGIAYFWKNFIQRDKEVTLYCLLKFLESNELNSLWIREYEKACAGGIIPRDNLRAEYVRRK